MRPVVDTLAERDRERRYYFGLLVTNLNDATKHLPILYLFSNRLIFAPNPVDMRLRVPRCDLANAPRSFPRLASLSPSTSGYETCELRPDKVSEGQKIILKVRTSYDLLQNKGNFRKFLKVSLTLGFCKDQPCFRKGTFY